MAAPTLVSRVHTTPCDPGYSSGPFVSGSFDVAAGNLIVVLAAQDSYTTRPITTCTDTAGNTYTKASYVATTGTRAIACWYCLSSAAKTGNVVTLTNTGGSLSEKGTAVMQFNASGTWSYVGGAGYTAGAYNGTSTTGALNMTGAGVVVEFGTGDEDQAASGWNFTAGCSNYYGSSSSPDDTGEGSGVVGADLLSAANASHTFTATFANTHSLLGQWGFVVAGASTDSAAVTSALGSLATAATTAAAVAVAASCGMGGFSCNAGISAAMAVQDASALGAMSTAIAEHAANTATAAAALAPLVSAGTTAASQASAMAAKIGPLASAFTVSAINANTVNVVSALGTLAASGTIALSQSAALASQSSIAASLATNATQGIVASGQVGPLSSALTVNGININTAALTASLGALASRGTAAQFMAARASSALVLTSSGQTSASQGVSVYAQLPAFYASFAPIAQNAAAVHATLGPLSSAITIEPPPVGYAADGHYYVAIPARWFYAAMPARPFYILSNPNMTTAFSNLDPRETEVLTFDASNDLADGETLTTIEKVEVTVQSGAPTGTLPELTGQIINGSPVTLTVNGKTITIATGCCVQVVGSGGVTGTRYLIAITCNTSNPDKVLTLKGILPVSAQ